MYASSTAITTLQGAFSDTGSILVVAIAAVVAGAIALMGLGFGLRHLKKWVTGKKF